MTDITESVVESIVETEQENKPNVATPEQMEAIRNHLHNGFLGEYKKFVSILLNSPIANETLQHALHYFDNGMLWLKEATYHGPLVNRTPPSTKEEPQEEHVPSE